MSDEPRAVAMTRRVLAAAKRAGIDAPDLDRLRAALELVMARRDTGLPDDHHPDYLHPGRTALILLEDLGATDPAVIAGGTMLDSVRPELMPEAKVIRAVAGSRTDQLLEEVPQGDVAEDEVLEALIVASEPARLIALAERLDYARHLHLRPRDEWGAFHRVIEQAYLPAAARTHPTLERRLGSWVDMFARRFLRA